MARKKTTDEPTFAMVLERGRLVPAFADDAERLASWREGTKVLVTFSSREQRPLIIKWKALINDAIKGGNSPWTNAETADQAIKLALGMIDVEKAGVTKDGVATGQWIATPKSTKDFNDAQLEEFIEREVALLYQLTGVDYEKAYQDRVAEKRFVPDYPESSDNPPAPADTLSDEGRSDDPKDSTPTTEGPAAATQSTDPAEAGTPAIMPDADVGSADNPASKSAVGATLSSGEEKAAGVGDGAVSPPAVRYFYHRESDSLVTTADGSEAGEGAEEIDKERFDEIEKIQDEAIAAAKAEKKKADKIKPRTKGDVAGADAAWLLGAARRLVNATEPGCGTQYDHLLNAAVKNAIEHMPPGGVGDKVKEIANQIRVRCFAIADGKEKMDLRFIATMVGCKVDDLKTPETK